MVPQRTSAPCNRYLTELVKRNSTDSRVPAESFGIGFVPHENLVGRLDRVVFSFAERSPWFVWTWRSGRFFKKVE